MFIRTVLLHGIFGGPFSSSAIMPSLVRLQKLSNVGNQGIIRVGVGQEGTNRKQNFANRQCWTPLILQNVKTNTTVWVDVAVKNRKSECIKRVWDAKCTNNNSRLRREDISLPVVDTCGKMNFRRLHCRETKTKKGWGRLGIKVITRTADAPMFTYLEGIVGRKVNVQEKDSARIGRVFRTHNSGLPVEHIIPNRSSGTVWRRIFSKIHQLLNKIQKKQQQQQFCEYTKTDNAVPLLEKVQRQKLWLPSQQAAGMDWPLSIHALLHGF